MSYTFSSPAVFKYGMSNPAQLEDWLNENPNIIGLSFIGRSNVGKSSTINSLFGRKTARVSKTPGRTREINIFEFQLKHKGKVDENLPAFFLFDLPGYGHAEVSKDMTKNWQELMNTFFVHSPLGITMVNIQDARHPNQTADKKFYEYINNFTFEIIVALNKVDKLKKQKEKAALKKQMPELIKEYKYVKQVHFVSAESKQGIDDLESSLINLILEKTAKLSVDE